MIIYFPVLNVRAKKRHFPPNIYINSVKNFNDSTM